MSFIGIDIGAYFVKGALLDIEEMRLKDLITRPFPGFVSGLPPGHREVCCRDIEAVFLDVVSQLVTAAGSVEAVFVSNQMHGFVLCEESGLPLGNFVSWQDTRTLEPCEGRTFFEVILGKVPESILLQIGRELKPGYPSAVLAWLGAHDQLRPGAVVCSLGDYLAARLANSYPITDASNASSLGLLDVERRSWFKPLLEVLGLEMLRLPEVREAVGNGNRSTHPNLGFVQAPVGDQQAALLGVGLRPEEISINVATGSQVALLADAFIHGAFQVRPYFDGRFLKTVTHIPAGRALNSLARLLSEVPLSKGSVTDEDFWRYAIAAAEHAATGETLRCDLSFFPCATGQQGAILGIREESLTVGRVIRAAFENMAANYERFGREIDSDGRARSIVFSGGLARKTPLLRQLVTARLGLPWRATVAVEEALMGLVVLARCHADRSSVKAAMGFLRE